MAGGDMRRLLVIGTGQMGPGIALSAARGGCSVTLYGRSQASLAKGMENWQATVRDLLAYEIIDPDEADSAARSIAGTTDLDGAAKNAEWIIESIAEDLAVKHDLYRHLDDLCPAETIITSNTSGLRATDIGSVTRRPTLVLTTHFWNPPALMELVEVVPGDTHDPAISQRVMDALNSWGNKTAVLVRKDILGQLGNRLQHALLRETCYLLDSGAADAETLDIVLKKSFGLRSPVMGPLETADLVGLQTVVAIQRYLTPDLYNEPRPVPVLEAAVAGGNLGAATGRGLRDWSDRDPNDLRAVRQSYLLEWFASQRRKQRAAAGSA
jgi:3-hydroxybutyryl-CoA dehydrogenase